MKKNSSFLRFFLPMFIFIIFNCFSFCKKVVDSSAASSSSADNQMAVSSINSTIYYTNGTITGLDAVTGAAKFFLDPLTDLQSKHVLCAPLLADSIMYTSGYHKYEFYALKLPSKEILWQTIYDSTGQYYDQNYFKTHPLCYGNGLLFAVAGPTYPKDVAYTKLFALNAATGNIIWTKNFTSGTTAFELNTTPPIYNDGKLYICSSGICYAFDASTGNIIWQNNVGKTRTIFIPCCIGEGKLFTATSNTFPRYLYAIDMATGTTTWQKDITPIGFSAYSLLSYEGNKVYLNGSDTLYAFNPVNGDYKWKFFESGLVNVPYYSPVAYSNNTIYATTADAIGNGKLYSIDAKSGVKNWDYTASGTTAPLASSGYVFLPGGAVFTAEGTLVRQASIASGLIGASPVLVKGNGVVVYGADSGMR